MNYSFSPCFFGVPNEDGIYQVSFEVTNRCNLHCIHCMNKSDNTENAHNGLQWEEMSLLLDEMNECNVKELYISGGEPTMYPYFEKLVEKSKKLGMDTLIATNAYNIEDYLDVIKKNVDIVFVSIDGTPERHDFFRGCSGAYYKTMSNIRRMLSMEIPVRISTVVSKNNLDDLENIIRDLCDIGVFQVHFTVLVNVGRATSGEMLVSSDEYKEITDAIEALQKKYAKENFLITTRRNGKLTEETEPCYGGRRMAHINADGIVSPCSYVGKCEFGKTYNIQWKPGSFKECLNHVRKFQLLCEKRQSYFGHSSCAALASITTGSDSEFVIDPLDRIW